MFNSQRFPLNLYPSNVEKDIVISLLKKCWILFIYSVLSEAYMRKLLNKETTTQNNQLLARQFTYCSYIFKENKKILCIHVMYSVYIVW